MYKILGFLIGVGIGILILIVFKHYCRKKETTSSIRAIPYLKDTVVQTFQMVSDTTYIIHSDTFKILVTK